MKRRNLFSLLLLPGTILLAAIVGEAAAGRGPPLLRREVEELRRCGHRRHADAVRYALLAERSRESGALHQARLLGAMARSARLQEGCCALAVSRLGGSYGVPALSEELSGREAVDLELLLQTARRELTEERRAAIARTMEAGNRYAGRVLVRVAAGEMRHVVLLERCLARQGDSDIYLVCPECGMVCDEAHGDLFCPVCLTDSRRFERFE